MRGILAICVLLLAACESEPPTREEAANRCEERARDAQAPNVGVKVGASSNDGPFASVDIGVTTDLLRGRDPLEVYEECVFNLTGEPPIRPARLRAL
ncbi:MULTISPECIES: hypothetical protein [unclassified Cognatiyoonia]|uniref:hypothetical protein n=1 Tax=unclassified Cognatiyoonia TaxID=2635977 RepID=UPI002A171B5F|nr:MULTISPECIES: hypothetical protein [unclassified Cognatiyoonia]MDX8347011.1 hypothetical protein [Cognatiyoonia sp. IB215446]MDX8351758.1 hypothetical protein [Cognatiyoonia sp. IB215182]